MQATRSARVGEAREVFERMVGGTAVGRDELMCGIIVYGICEGFARALGGRERDPDRFHEGDGLPRGLAPDVLLARAVEVYDHEDLLDGADIAKAQMVAIGHGYRLERGLPAFFKAPARGAVTR